MADAEYEADGDESKEDGDENGKGIGVVATCDNVSLLTRLCSGRMTPSSSTARMHRQNIVITPLKL